VAAQAVDLRKVAKLGAGTQRAYDWVRGLSPFVDVDRSLGAEVEAVGVAVLSPPGMTVRGEMTEREH